MEEELPPIHDHMVRVFFHLTHEDDSTLKIYINNSSTAHHTCGGRGGKFKQVRRNMMECSVSATV